MLAYVFWHWKRTDVAAADYEASQRGFHQALAAHPPSGYHQSMCLALTGASWAASGGDAYEDWYLVDDFASLGLLNDAAVSASRLAPHDAAAALVEGGTGAVYGLRAGSILPRPGLATWFQKPSGMRYPEFDQLLAPVIDACGGALWIRQMTLGPAREFCLHSAAAPALPASTNPLSIPLRPVWPE